MVSNYKVYPSKKGFIIYIPVIMLAIVAITSIVVGEYLGSIICTVVLALVILPMLFNTQYTIINNAQLKVKCGFFVNLLIDINSIKKIENTKSLLSSPALSLDRIEVFYNNYDSVIISPQEKDSFITALKTVNPKIEYFNNNTLS